MYAVCGFMPQSKHHIYGDCLDGCGFTVIIRSPPLVGFTHRSLISVWDLVGQMCLEIVDGLLFMCWLKPHAAICTQRRTWLSSHCADHRDPPPPYYKFVCVIKYGMYVCISKAPFTHTYMLNWSN